MSKYFPEYSHYVAGVGTLNGKQFFYTGRAGADFVSESRAEAFTYQTKEGAEYRANVLNLSTKTHCVTFSAQESVA
jgi:hypothetical protein